MMKMFRTPAPVCLTDMHPWKYGKNKVKYPKYKYWGFKYKDQNDASKKFDWHVERSVLADELLAITKNHCSFCDSYRLKGAIKDEIEHFRPKHLHPLLAYYWGNLFICCRICQETPKGWNKKDIKLVLKPDSLDYAFSKYFYYHTKSHEIKANPYNDDKHDQLRAAKTIEYYKLNNPDRIKAREEAFNLYNQSNFELDKRQYRFMFRVKAQ